jgi:hypothetical protein
MQSFFTKPTPQDVSSYIYNQVIARHEIGGKSYVYKIPNGMSISFVNEVIERLGEYLLDVDVIELSGGCIMIDWS